MADEQSKSDPHAGDRGGWVPGLVRPDGWVQSDVPGKVIAPTLKSVPASWWRDALRDRGIIT